MTEIALLLSSGSPRRRQLLAQLGVTFEIFIPTVSEAVWPGELPEDYVSRVALEKAREGWHRRGRAKDVPVLGADTCISVDGRIIGKPSPEVRAAEILSELSGRTHQVLTAIAMVNGKAERISINNTAVTMRELTGAEIVAYCALGESEDKAGAYAIQGMAAMFIKKIDGSYSGVMGLPLYETALLLRPFGFNLLS